MPTCMPRQSHYFQRVFHGLMPLCKETVESESPCPVLQTSLTITEEPCSEPGWTRDTESSKTTMKSIPNGYVLENLLKLPLLSLREPLRYWSGKVLGFIGLLEDHISIER